MKRVGLIVWALTLGSLQVLSSQEAGREGPRSTVQFLAVASHGSAPVPVDASQVAVLRRKVSLTFKGATLEEALGELGRQAGIKFAYSGADVPLGEQVTLRAEGMTVAAVLTELLIDLGVDVVVAPDNRLALVHRRGKGGRVVVATITGRVTDAKTGDPLVGVEVWLEGTRLKASSGERGFYRIVDAPAGNYTLAARRLGYLKQTRAVTVVGQGEVTVDLALQPVATQLNELVTTMTGEQRRAELGHVVGVINADSLVKEAPITTLSQLLTARVPGLVVSQGQGTVGGVVKLQIRGVTSLTTLSSEPIIIIDGIRMTSRGGTGPSFSAERTSPLNDVNPNDVASVEVVKGPSAATLYGTDAANGVIVITTKRGQAGTARWNAFARGMTDGVPTNRIEEQYRGWAHDTLGNNFSCNLAGVAAGLCTQDSVVRSTTLSGAGLSMLKPARSGAYGASVSGGQQALRYYFGASYNSLMGAVGLPDSVIALLKNRRSVPELPEELIRPNSQTSLQLRSNVTVALKPWLEITANAGFTSGRTRAVAPAFQPYRVASSTADTATLITSITNYFASQSKAADDRFLTSLNGRATMAPWLSARATLGLDVASRNRDELRARDQTRTLNPTGIAANGDNRVLALSGDLGVTAEARHGPVSFRTSVGAQYVRTLLDGLYIVGLDLPPGATSVQTATTKVVNEIYAETATLGGFVEQTVGLHDRLYLTGALRVDGATSFGSGYEAAAYPKLSASWVVSDEPFMPRIPGLAELRLRSAFGVSGKQPDPAWSIPNYQRFPDFIPGATDYVVYLAGLGNPEIRPERTRELEAGIDAGLLGGRARAELTWYKRRTTDQIMTQSLPIGVGFGVAVNAYTNVGLTEEHGFEAQLSATLLESSAISWDVTIQHSLHGTKLVKLGQTAAMYNSSGSLVEGYPLGARFIFPIESFSDANGDGIIAADEVVLGTERKFVGENYPRSTQTLTSTVGLFDRRLRLSALLDRENVSEINASFGCASCRVRVDPTTPLAEQAAAVAYAFNAPEPQYVETGSFTRLREVSAAVTLPSRIVRSMGFTSVNLTVSARNLALWSKFSGADPESKATFGTGGWTNGIPQTRTWSLRCDLGL